MAGSRRYNYPVGSPRIDLSGGVQTTTSRILRRPNELAAAKNAHFHTKIGSAVRRPGYEQVGNTIQQGNDGLGLHVYKYFANNKLIAGINNAAGTSSTLQYFDVANYWTTLLTTTPANVRFSMIDFLDELYIVGRAPDSDSYITTTNIDSTLTASTSHNVYGAPQAKGIMEYSGQLFAINCKVGSVKYRDRIYISSAPLGAITFVQNDQVGLLQQLKTDSARYLKAGMQIDIYSAGTNAKVVSGLTIVTVNKSKNIITFAATAINVKDNDELWLTGTKGKLNVFWNTDYPTPETADWLRVPPGVEENPELTGWGKSNNRAFFFTRNSVWKYDGANFVNVHDSVGCVAENTICNIGNWLIWLHNTGVYGYNDSTGQFKLLSRAVDKYIKAINQSSISKASAVVSGRIYKLAVSEVSLDLDASTTSTSTSSTSTSSTSSSTSSTSTSSTSTSSTSSSTSTSNTTSTSTSSTSTSSTSTSSTSTSLSTSSTSTSQSTSTTVTTTLASTKNVLRLIYDFDSNTWAPEYHKREFRQQILHAMNGYIKPYFIDETGRVFRDETGSLDHHDTIPFEVELGRSFDQTPLRKNLVGCLVHTENARGTQIMLSVDGGNFADVGQVTLPEQEFLFKPGTIGRDTNYKFVHNGPGDGPQIDGVITYSSAEELVF